MSDMRRRTVLSVATVAILLSAVGCNASNPQVAGSSAPTSGILNVAVASDIDTLDPAVTIDNASWKITYPCYERLVGYKGATTELQPELATSWSDSDNGRVWTFKLATDHKFSDGSPVDAEAVKFSFNRTLKINKGPAGFYAPVVATIETPDSATVKFTLTSPLATFPALLAANYGNIVNPKVMEHESNGDQGQAYLAEHTMGSGPYELVGRVKGQSLTLGASPHPNGAQPAISKAVFQIVSDPSAQRLQLEKGDIDIAEGITLDQIKAMQGAQGTTVVQKPSLLVDYIYLNAGKGNPALKNTQVRQAISYAIDYEGIIKASQNGQATQMRGPLPQGMWGHDGSLMQYTHDPAKAKQLLAAANAGDIKPLTLLYSDRQPWWPTEALAIQANLNEVGIPVELSKVDYATGRQLIDQGKFDLALGVWSPDYGDPTAVINPWFDSKNPGLAGNRAFYDNPQVDSLISEASASTDQGKREELYQQIQKIVVEDAPYVYLYQTNYLLPMRSNITGFEFNPMLQGIYNLAQMNKS